MWYYVTKSKLEQEKDLCKNMFSDAMVIREELDLKGNTITELDANTYVIRLDRIIASCEELYKKLAN